MRVLAIFEDFFQAHGIEEHCIVQMGRVRANLNNGKKRENVTDLFFFSAEFVEEFSRPVMCTDLFFRCQVAPEWVLLESFIHLLKEVIVLIAFVGFLANDKGHVKRSHGVLVNPAAQGMFPQAVLLREKRFTCKSLVPQ